MKNWAMIAIVITILIVGFASPGVLITWRDPLNQDVNYKLYRGPDLNSLTLIYIGTDLFFNIGPWPNETTVLTATSETKTEPLLESKQSDLLIIDPECTVNVLGESTKTVLVLTDSGGQQTEVFRGGEGTYTFYTITRQAAPDAVEPPEGVEVGE